VDWTEIIGEDRDRFCDRLSERAPPAADRLSQADTRFLFTRALEARADVVIALGTGAGFAAAVLCYALHFASRAGFVVEQFEVVLYDIVSVPAAGGGRRVGTVADEILTSELEGILGQNPELLDRIRFRRPAAAANIRADHAPDSLSFALVNGDRRHPWPTLNVLAVLDCLRPGADVVLHDVDPSAHNGGHVLKGVTHLFANLVDEREATLAADPGSMRPIVVPPDKEVLRDRLLTSLYAYPWEVELSTAETTCVFA
jgi:predicted O-methyltransferase YrrM